MSRPLGLESGAVTVVEYDARWPGLFAAEAVRLEKHCRGLRLRFEHVGSTAVPGMVAKPVLDILAGRPAGSALDACIAAVAASGYIHRGEQDVPGREFFRRGEPRSYHIHLVEHDGILWRRYVGFRDYLRTHGEAARQYAALKCELAMRFPRDREAYIDGKAPFVTAVLDRLDGTPSPEDS